MKKLMIIGTLGILAFSLFAQSTNEPAPKTSQVSSNVLDPDGGTWAPRYELDPHPFHTIWQEAGTNIVELDLRTNVVVQWMAIEQIQGQPYDHVKQVGVLVTNRMIEAIHDGTTNQFLLKMLGREDWPSQRRVVMVPKPKQQP